MSIVINNLNSQFALFKDGDPNAFRYYYDLYHGALYTIVLGVVMDSEEAKDIVVTSFVKLMSYRTHLNGPDHLWKYLYIVAKNEAIDYLRRLKMRRKAEDKILQSAETVYSEAKEDEAIYMELLYKVADAMELLPPQQRKILTLRYFFGKNVRGIARLLCLEEQTVRNHLAKGIQFLRNTASQQVAGPLR